MTTVIVPAANEEQVIARCLASLYAATQHPEDLDVIVVLNGCKDRTRDAVEAAAPTARIVELPEPGKASALRAGDQLATDFPRVFLDADVTLGVGALDLMREALATTSPRVAAPRPIVNLTQVPTHLAPYYQVWLKSPWHLDRLVGSGVYALNEAARQRFENFPDVHGDDYFISRLFDRSERIVVDSSFTISPPRTLRSLVQVRRRVHAGNRVLGGTGTTTRGSIERHDWLFRLLYNPRNWYGLLLYVAVNGLARRGAPVNEAWARDETARGI